MSVQFLARIYKTTHLADFTDHDGTVCTVRREALPIGTPIAIDANGDVFITRDLPDSIVIGIPESRGLTTLFRDHWQSASININAPHNAGPYFHAVLNALNWKERSK